MNKKNDEFANMFCGDKKNHQFLKELKVGDLFSYKSDYRGALCEPDLYLVLEKGKQPTGVENKNAILVFMLVDGGRGHHLRRGWFSINPACHGTFKLLSR